MGRHGGGAFSGKDPSKVDRSGAYFCRFVARQVVKQGFAKRAEVQVAYAIGRAEPVSVRVDTFGTGDWQRGRGVRADVRLSSGGDDRAARAAPSDLPPDDELRPLRQAGAELGGVESRLAGPCLGVPELVSAGRRRRSRCRDLQEGR